MGTSSYNSQIFSHQHHKWVQFGKLQLVSRKDNTIGQYRLMENMTDFHIKCYILRAINKNCLVDVLALYELNNMESSGLEIGGILPQHKYLLVGERICYRLPDLGSISYHDALYVLKQALKAIPILYNLFTEGFQIQEEAIGINAKGECKFWVNSDYFSNTVELSQEKGRNSQYSQVQLILANQEASGNCCPKEPSPQSKTKNLQKTLKNLIEKLQSRVMPMMSKQEKTSYQSQKIKHLSKKSDTIIILKQKQTLGTDKSLKTIKNKKSENNSDRLVYQIQNVQKWVNQMCAQAGVGQQYRISLGEAEQYRGNAYFQSSHQKIYELKNQKNETDYSRELKVPTVRVISNKTNCKIIAQARTSLRRMKYQYENEENYQKSSQSSIKQNKNEGSRLLKTQKPSILQFSSKKTAEESHFTKAQQQVSKDKYFLSSLQSIHQKKQSSNSQSTGQSTNQTSQNKILSYANLTEFKQIENENLLSTPKSRYSISNPKQSSNFPSRQEQSYYNTKSNIEIKTHNDKMLQKNKSKHRTEFLINYDNGNQRNGQVVKNGKEQSRNVYYEQRDILAQLNQYNTNKQNQAMGLHPQVKKYSPVNHPQPQTHIQPQVQTRGHPHSINFSYTNPIPTKTFQNNEVNGFGAREYYSNFYHSDIYIL